MWDPLFIEYSGSTHLLEHFAGTLIKGLFAWVSKIHHCCQQLDTSSLHGIHGWWVIQSFIGASPSTANGCQRKSVLLFSGFRAGDPLVNLWKESDEYQKLKNLILYVYHEFSELKIYETVELWISNDTLLNENVFHKVKVLACISSQVRSKENWRLIIQDRTQR